MCFAICGVVGAFQHAPQALLTNRMKQSLPRQYTQPRLALKMGLESSKERTFIMVKPDGVVRGLCGRIIQRFEDKGLKLVATKFTMADPGTLNTHYGHIVDKPFYPEVFDYMTSAPVFQLVFEGSNAVVAGRALLGATDPMQAPLGTVRGDFGLGVDRNLCHGSDCVEAAETEIALWLNGKQKGADEAAGAGAAAAGAAGLERTFIMVKPDGVRRQLSGRIISRFEDKGLRLVAAKYGMVDGATLDTHYEHIADKPFYPEVSEYMRSGPVLQLVFQGLNAASAGRALLGATNPLDAALGTVRGDFGLSIDENICHGSDSVEGAEREIALWFPSDPQTGASSLLNWTPPDVLA